MQSHHGDVEQPERADYQPYRIRSVSLGVFLKSLLPVGCSLPDSDILMVVGGMHRNLTGTTVALWRTVANERAVIASYGGGFNDPEMVGVPAHAVHLEPGKTLPWSVGDWKTARVVRTTTGSLRPVALYGGSFDSRARSWCGRRLNQGFLPSQARLGVGFSLGRTEMRPIENVAIERVGYHLFAVRPRPAIGHSGARSLTGSLLFRA